MKMVKNQSMAWPGPLNNTKRPPRWKRLSGTRRRTPKRPRKKSMPKSSRKSLPRKMLQRSLAVTLPIEGNMSGRAAMGKRKQSATAARGIAATRHIMTDRASAAGLAVANPVAAAIPTVVAQRAIAAGRVHNMDTGTMLPVATIAAAVTDRTCHAGAHLRFEGHRRHAAIVVRGGAVRGGAESGLAARRITRIPDF